MTSQPTMPAEDIWGRGDAFGRQRVAEPSTLFDSKLTLDAAPLLWDDQEVTGGGTGSAHSTATASSTISVGDTTAGTRVRQTFRRFNYQPGKSTLVNITFVLDKSGGGTGITRRVGLCDDDNGIFLEDAEGELRFVRRTSASGSAVDNAVAQSDWNIDPMDGSGPSRLTIDLAKAQILVIDLEWLGVGSVRIGFVIDGVTYYAHEMRHANVLSSVYMSTPNLPLRYEIANDGTGAASSLECICSSVMSEGGQQPTGVVRAASTAGTHVAAADENTVYALLGIRLKSSALQSTIELLDHEIQIQSASSKVEWRLLWNPTVAGTFTYGDQANSAVQIATGATANTVTGGTLIGSGFAESTGNPGGGAGSAHAAISNALRLGAAIDGTRDSIVLAARPVGGSTNVSVEASLTWRELT